MSRMSEQTLPWMIQFASARTWISTIRSERTKTMYLSRLKQYCDAVGKNPDELIEFKVDGLRNVATAKEFQAEAMLNDYLFHGGLTATAQVIVLASVKSFYKANWRELNSNVGQGIELPEPKKRTPKIQDILDLDEAMTTHRDRAILWFLESAPLRRDSLTKLKWKDLQSTDLLLKQLREEAKGQYKRTVEEDTEIAHKVPYYFVVESARLKGAGKGRYKGVKHVGFIHRFAYKKIERYRQELAELSITIEDDEYIFVAYAHSWGSGKGDRLKIVSFDKASLMAWGDLEKKRFSPQDMRDFLQSALENAKVSQNIAAPMLGHKVKGVDKHYSNHDIDEFLTAYFEALPWLIPETLEQVKAETQKKLDAEQKKLNSLEFENNNLKANVNTLNKDQEWLKGQVAFLKKYVFDDKSVIETEEDVADLQAFLEKKRKQKENQNQTRAEDVEEEK